MTGRRCAERCYGAPVDFLEKELQKEQSGLRAIMQLNIGLGGCRTMVRPILGSFFFFILQKKGRPQE